MKYYYWGGLSSETKDTTDITIGALALESDTGDEYQWTGSSWQRTGVAGAARFYSPALIDATNYGVVGDGVTDSTVELQAAVDALAAAGGGTLQLPTGTILISSTILTSEGHADTALSAWEGFKLVGVGQYSTIIEYSGTGALFSVEAAEPYDIFIGVDFEKMTLKGPGLGVPGTVGIKYAPNSNTTKLVHRSTWRELLIYEFETIGQFNDCTSLDFYRCWFKNYLYGLSFGYNVDIVLANECNFGDTLDSNSITPFVGTALYHNYISSYTGHTAANGNSAHKYLNCWFMAQLLCSNIYESDDGPITFDTCYYERCTQIATLGNSGTTSGPNVITWLNCYFDGMYDSSENVPKIQWVGTGGNSSARIRMIGCYTQGATGPNAGWIGNSSLNTPNAVIYLEGNVLIHGGTASSSTFTAFSVANDTVTVSSASALSTGTPVTITNGGTLPTGITAGPTYYVVRSSTTTIKFSDTRANALAGLGIVDLSGTTSGTHTITAAAVVDAHLVIGAKLIVTPDSATYVYHGSNAAYNYATFDATGAGGRPQFQVHTYNGADGALFARYGVTSVSSDTEVDNTGEIKARLINAKYWACWEGGLRVKPSTTALPTAAAAYRGQVYVLETASVDHFYVCKQTGASTWQWYEITGLT